jgi:ATP phosphoribosyltransferase
LKRFSIYPLWGAAEAYPPENADIVLLSRKNEGELSVRGLVSLGMVVDFKAVLIANRCSLKEKDMSEFISAIAVVLPGTAERPASPAGVNEILVSSASQPCAADQVKLALPDGHQQAHVRKILDAAGIPVEDYPSASGNRSPQSGMDGVSVKVMRPQDMPLQVANGNFDIAITGRDWLTDHIHQFPTSPVIELMDLKYGWVRIVAVVDNTVPVNDRTDLKPHCRGLGRPYRVASEYVNIADNYARENQLGMYRVIPTWGATEAFLPEDADVLIENTETGSTIARHNLKIIDTLFESTACVIGRQDAAAGELKKERIAGFLSAMSKGVAALA